MTNSDLPNDDLLQFVFGELDDARRPAVRKAIAEDAELAAVAQGLASAVAAVRAEYVGKVSDEFNDRLRRRLLDVFDGVPADTTRPTFLTRLLTNWRWIMRHPISRVAAAAIFVLAVTGVALWFHGGGTQLAFADFIEPILNAKTAKFKITTEMTGTHPGMKWLPAEMMKGLPSVTTSKVMVLDATRSRQETEMPDKSKWVMISDWGRGKTLSLSPETKQATVFNAANMTKEQVSQQDMFAWFRSILLDARDKPAVKRESLGEKEIDGRRVVGFRVNTRGMVLSLWGDPKTGLPVRAETTMAMFPNVKSTMSDFAFNVDMDESLFSVEPPAGYEVIQAPPIDASPAEEKDLIGTFRHYSELSGGPFPDSLDMGSLYQMVLMKKYPPKFPPEKGQKPSAKQMQEIMEAQAKLQRGLMFSALLPKEADAHYAGKGVSLGAAGTPIFWYRPKDEKKYRVIYADLSVRDADTPPSVPAAQPEKDLIDMFRHFSELSGGPFPDSLDLEALEPLLKKKFRPEKGQKPSAKQMQVMMETVMKFQPSLAFVGSLPPQADAHYAGKGVSLGAADKPIFWYRPTDAKNYRVVYADLSLRDADTPPSVPIAQPVPGPSSPKK
ncbi:MAG: hypothetical protein ACLP9L_15435 [Thermoguttaceae bacterium]